MPSTLLTRLDREISNLSKQKDKKEEQINKLTEEIADLSKRISAVQKSRNSLANAEDNALLTLESNSQKGD